MLYLVATSEWGWGTINEIALPPMENPLWDQICRGLLYRTNLIYMESQQLQRQVPTFKNLDVAAPQKSDPSWNLIFQKI